MIEEHREQRRVFWFWGSNWGIYQFVRSDGDSGVYRGREVRKRQQCRCWLLLGQIK